MGNPENNHESSEEAKPLHICPDPQCGSEFVQLFNDDENDEGKVIIERFCPECEWHVVDEEVDGEALDRFMDELIDGKETLERALRRSEIARFVVALQHVRPEDF